MLEIENLVVRYGIRGDALTAVDGVSLTVPKGGTLGLVGESGSGKSTIARAVLGLVPVSEGSITLEGIDHSSHKARNARSYRKRVQMVFQDPYASLNPRMTVGAAVKEALALGGVNRSEQAAEASRVLELVGLSAKATGRYPHEFSGGQRQRIAIARAIAVRPTVIVMDEVTSALDVSVQATILNLLKGLQKELGLSYLFISHDLAVVGVMSSFTAVMYLGRVVERAPTETLFANPRHPYTRALIASVPRFGAARLSAPVAGDLPDPRLPPGGCRYHTRCAIGPVLRSDRSICQQVDPQSIANGMPHEAACHFAVRDDVLPEFEAERVAEGNDL